MKGFEYKGGKIGDGSILADVWWCVRVREQRARRPTHLKRQYAVAVVSPEAVVQPRLGREGTGSRELWGRNDIAAVGLLHGGYRVEGRGHPDAHSHGSARVPARL